MNKILMAAALIAAMYGSALAQSTTPSTTDPGNPPAQAPNAPATQAKPQTSQAPVTSPATGKTQSSDKPKIAPGSVIPVQLTKTVDAKKVKTGDEVVTKVTMDMKTQSGDVLVPKDTKVIGHVTAAQARNKEQKESQLAIAFDRAVTKDGNSMQLPMSIQAVIGQQQMNDNSGGGEGNEAPAAGGGGASGGMAPSGGGRAPGAGSSASNAPAPTTGGASDTPSASSSRPPINGQTTGVVGISNLTLAPAAGGAQGSVLTSEKNNVKLESGTMLLLKVNQQ
jgi:hypothetical protein